jgi:hypothetical protein
MLYTLIGLLLFFWVLGLVAKVGGNFVHTLLAIAVVLFLFNVVSGRRVDI